MKIDVEYLNNIKKLNAALQEAIDDEELFIPHQEDLIEKSNKVLLDFWNRNEKNVILLF